MCGHGYLSKQKIGKFLHYLYQGKKHVNRRKIHRSEVEYRIMAIIQYQPTVVIGTSIHRLVESLDLIIIFTPPMRKA